MPAPAAKRPAVIVVIWVGPQTSSMPLAEAVLLVWRYIADEEQLQAVFERHRGRCYEDTITFPVMVQLITDALLDKKDREPIPGFYAAGVITSGWESYDYGGTPSGTALSFSITSGRIAGRSAAKYLQGE